MPNDVSIPNLKRTIQNNTSILFMPQATLQHPTQKFKFDFDCLWKLIKLDIVSDPSIKVLQKFFRYALFSDVEVAETPL